LALSNDEVATGYGKTMAKYLDRLKEIFRDGSHRPKRRTRPRRRGNPPFVGRSSTKEIEDASPERAGELAGHAVERVET
jgi:hypothetical protein